MLAPSVPRTASGMMSLVSVQSRPLELSEASATVALDGAAETIADAAGAPSVQRDAASSRAYIRTFPGWTPCMIGEEACRLNYPGRKYEGPSRFYT